jgi:hypothetical protein
LISAINKKTQRGVDDYFSNCWKNVYSCFKEAPRFFAVVLIGFTPLPLPLLTRSEHLPYAQKEKRVRDW